MQGADLFLVERYLPDASEARLAELAQRLADAASSMRDEGHDVEWLQSLGLPADEACFCVFRACDEETVAEANRRAGADYERIGRAVALPQL